MVSKDLFFPAISEDPTKTLSLPPSHTTLATASLRLLQRYNFSRFQIMTIFQPALRQTGIFPKSVHDNRDFGGNP